MNHKLVYFYPILLAIYSVYSYTQTAPNLVLSSNPVYWQFQQHMWQLGYHNRPISALLFLVFVLAFFGLYLAVLSKVKQQQLSLKRVLIILTFCIVALLPSYPSLSNDIFNYLMNAKMMHVYQASPYVHAAWDFPDDPWPKFMMNVHTTTPYGVVWTSLGYVVYALTFGDLQFGMLGFRILGILAVLLISWSIWVVSNKRLYAVTLFCLNPLVLLEAVSNTHNDMTMMAFFMAGLALYTLYFKKQKLIAYAGITVFWLLSVYTKLITVISPFVYLGYMPIRKFVSQKINAYDLLTFALVVIMCTDGSKRFFSWYLLWAIPLSTLAKNRFSHLLLVGLSFGGLLSYLPYLYTGEYSAILGNIRIAIYFLPGLLFSLYSLMRLLITKRAYEN